MAAPLPRPARTRAAPLPRRGARAVRCAYCGAPRVPRHRLPMPIAWTNRPTF
ncbi:hypothetical protein DF143_27790 [Burkholderia cenocepacia]|nr:hypothetical protein DF143_27790 [Burkholderia cenocepacia]RQV38145.1 hypothetical protein DF033_26990 [Burkholderia cenocepacia]HDR9873305.1 hypothetical protein [Burkholderia cenocepacia]